MALTEIGARLRLANSAGFKRDADKAAGSLGKLAREAGQADRKVTGLERAAKRSRSALGSITKGVAFGAIGAAVAGVGALSVGLIQGFKDAASLQTMLAKTDAVIKSTGGAAKVSAASVLKMSDELEALSMMDQEAILNGQNLLLTFTNVRNGVGETNHIFDQATKAMVDMSVAMGSDPQTAAIQLGKALNDPVKGVAALSKAGVQFTDQQKKTIKSLVASGRTMDAQKVILKELNTQFGGAAKAAGSGFEGALFRAKDALGDLFRDVATPLLPGFTRKIEDLSGYLTNTATPAITNFVKGFQAGTGDGGKFRDDLIGVWEAAKDVGETLQVAYEKTKQIADFVRNNGAVFGPITAGIAGYWAAMKLASIWTGTMAALNLGKMATGIAGVGTASAGAAPGVGAFGAAAARSAGPIGALAGALMALSSANKLGSTFNPGGDVDKIIDQVRSGKYGDALGTAWGEGLIKDEWQNPGAKAPALTPAIPFQNTPKAPIVTPRLGGSSGDRLVPGVSAPKTYRDQRDGGNLRTPLVVNVQVDKRTIGTVAIEDMEDRMARR